MKPYLISYDLDQPGQQYQNLFYRLQALRAVRVLYSEWLVQTSWSALQIRDYLAPAIDSNDRLFVVGLTGEAAWSNVMLTHDKVEQLLTA